ncbi:hypothetical protein [Streptomyces sp. NPDC049555]|uniref:hypothetical protein n=1 Tax=unclassified Streptomyces TaxID=2593676 RepID=UPI0034302D05
MDGWNYSPSAAVTWELQRSEQRKNDGNLAVRVFLDSTRHASCETGARGIAQAALAAMPPAAG